MGLRLRDSDLGILGEAGGRRVYFISGEAKTLAFAGYAVSDADRLTALKLRLEHAAWPYEAMPEDVGLFQSGSIAFLDPDGTRLHFGIARASRSLNQPSLEARLQHVVVASRDAPRLSQFYQSVVGFTLSDNVVDDKGDLTTAFLRCSEEHHSFAVFQASSDRFDHHCYEAGEWDLIRDWGDHFANERIKVEWGPGRHGPGNNLFLFIHDIDGNWVEISAELEIVAPNRPVGEWPHEQRTLNSWGSAPLRT
jgi:catechol 2,3-dioxygenase